VGEILTVGGTQLFVRGRFRAVSATSLEGRIRLHGAFIPVDFLVVCLVLNLGGMGSSSGEWERAARDALLVLQGLEILRMMCELLRDNVSLWRAFTKQSQMVLTCEDCLGPFREIQATCQH
jgi:hypothetical protein